MKTIATFAIACIVGLTILSGMAVADERMDVSTDKTIYAVGESVIIDITNQAREPILLNGYWITDSNMVRIYTLPVPAFAHYLNPDETYTYSWNQIDDSGNQVHEGTYIVNFDRSSASIEVAEGVFALSASMDTYITGENVLLTIANTGSVAVTIPGGYSVIDERGNTVYAMNTLAFVLVLQPGEHIEYVWDQSNDMGDRVPEGVYKISSNGQDITISIISETVIQDQLWDGGADNGNGQVPDLGFIKKPLPRRIGPRI